MCGAARVRRRRLRHWAGVALGRGIHAHPRGHAEHVHAGESPPSSLTSPLSYTGSSSAPRTHSVALSRPRAIHTTPALAWQAGGELQLSTNCSVFRVPLQRGDVAVGPPYDPHCVDALTFSSHTPLRPLYLQVYRSRHRHRVTTVTAPRAVLAVEWWRGEQTSRPTRPGKAGKQLLEPAGTGSETDAVLPLARSDDALAIGNVDSNENAIDEL